MHPIYLLLLSSLFLFHSPRTSQCISLSRLCGRFGHSCFGGKQTCFLFEFISNTNKCTFLANWGKRATAPLSSDEQNLEDTLRMTDHYRSVIILIHSLSHHSYVFFCILETLSSTITPTDRT